MKINSTGVYEFEEDFKVFIDSMWYDNIRAKKGTKFMVLAIYDGYLECADVTVRSFREAITGPFGPAKIPRNIDLPIKRVGG